MSLIGERYSIAPQLKDYDQLATDWRPYTMFRQSSNFISKSVTTDEHGQRYTLPKNGKRVNQANVVGKYDIVVGASTAFGVGSSCDSKSIASGLSNYGKRTVISLTGRAYNSKQELLLFLEHINKPSNIENVIIISGANNLYVSAFNDKYGVPFFWSNDFYKATKTTGLNRKIRLASAFFNFFGINEIDWRKINKSNIFEKISEGIQHSLGSEFISNIDVKSAADRTISDLMIFKSLSSLSASIYCCLQPVAGWMQKPLAPRENFVWVHFKTSKRSYVTIFRVISIQRIRSYFKDIL